jgi:hypothetical protein
MNTITGKKPLAKLTGFNGMWMRGSHQTCPPDHLTDCVNCVFPGPGEVRIRENFEVQNDIAGRNIVSYAVVSLAGGAVLLTLDNAGTLRDETAAIVLIAFSGANDFSTLNIFGRSYITLKLNGKALPGSHTFYYDGVTLHQTGWTTPGVAPTVAQVNVGTVDPGVHSFAYSFISPTGFLSKPSPLATITSDGVHTVSFTNIPVGPAGTTGRVLFATRANENELFFVPGGQINDNVTLVFEYTSFDTSLIVSADYLNNILASIPSCAALKFYRGRMVVIGRDGSPDSILVSDQSQPETINLVNNVVNLPVEQGINTSCGGMILRSTLYITKPNATYSVQDNGGNPNTWGVDIVDSGIGAFDNGISVFASSMSAQDTFDSCFILHKNGLMFFNGTYSEVALTYKIDTLWRMIDKNYFYLLQIAHDVWDERVYISVPLKSNGTGDVYLPDTRNSIVLMADHVEGNTPMKIKWSVWLVPTTNISVENFTLNYTDSTMIYQFTYSNAGNIIYRLATTYGLPDYGHLSAPTTILNYIITAPIAPGGTVIFNMLNLVFNGGKHLVNPSVWNKTRTLASQVNYLAFDLGTYNSSMELQRGINFTNEGIQVMLMSGNVIFGAEQAYFWLSKIDVYGTVMYSMRPALVENT